MTILVNGGAGGGAASVPDGTTVYPVAGVVNSSGRMYALIGPDGLSGISKTVTGLTYAVFGDSFSQGNNSAINISAATANNGIVTVVTAAPHKVRDGQRVSITNTGNATLNVRNYPIASYISTTSYTYTKSDAVGSTATGFSVAQNCFGYTGDVVIANALMGGRMRFIGNYGAWGEDTSQMLARVTEVISAAPNIVFFQGGTNDATNGLSYAQSAANIEAIVAKLAAAGILVVVKTIPPYGATGGIYTAARATQLLNVNADIRKLPSRYPGVVMVDAYRALINPTDANGLGTTGFYRPGDQIHYNARGAMAMARLIQTALQNVVPAVDMRPTSIIDNFGFNSANNSLFDNSPWNTTGGTVNAPATGALPTNWVIDAPSGTFTAQPACSVAARSDGFGFEVTIASQAGAAGAGYTVRSGSTAINARIPSFVGRKYRLLVEIEVTNGLTGALRGLYVSANVNVGVATGEAGQALTNNPDTGIMQFDTDTATRLTLTSPEFVIPSGAVTTVFPFAITAFFDAASAVSCTLKISNVQWQSMDDI